MMQDCAEQKELSEEQQKELSEEQKEFIRSSIEHFFEYPPDEKELAHEIDELMQVLEEEPLLKVEHKYALLQKCYLNPTACFHRLENLNSDISIGSVKKYILDYIIQQVEEAARQAQLNLADLAWDPILYHHKLRQQNKLFETDFKSQAQRLDAGEHPWQIPIDKNKIFTAEFVQLPELLALQVILYIHLPHWQPIQGEIIYYPEITLSEAEEDAYMREQHAIVGQNAEQYVSELLLQHLVNTKLITPSQKIRASRGAKKILVYRYYFEAISERKFDFEELLQISEKQAEWLSTSVITALLTAGKCNLKTAKNLTPQECMVIKNPFYFQELIASRIELHDIDGVSNKQSQTLNLPGVIYLQRKGKISFAEAKLIKSESAPIFKNELCLRMLMEDKLVFHEIIHLKGNEALILFDSYYAAELFTGRLSIHEIKNFSAYKIKLLLNIKIKELIKTKTLSIQEATQLSWREKELLSMNSIHKLFLAKKLTLADLHKISFGFAKMLDKNIYFYGLINKNILTINEALYSVNHREYPTRPSEKWGLNFGCRLIEIFKKSNPEENSEASLRAPARDLNQVIPSDFGFTKNEINLQALKVFFRYLHHELYQQKNMLRNKNSNYAQFITKLLLLESTMKANSLEEKDQPYEKRYVLLINKMVEIAKKKLQHLEENSPFQLSKRSRTCFSIFRPSNNETEIKRIKSLYYKLGQVAYLANINGARQERLKRSFEI